MDDMTKTEGTINHPQFGEMSPEEYRAYLLSAEEMLTDEQGQYSFTWFA